MKSILHLQGWPLRVVSRGPQLRGYRGEMSAQCTKRKTGKKIHCYLFIRPFIGVTSPFMTSPFMTGRGTTWYVTNTFGSGILLDSKRNQPSPPMIQERGLP